VADPRADTFLDPADDPREVDVDLTGDERSVLNEFIRFQRTTFELKCAGLTAEQLATRSVEPSTMSLLGLLRHLADVERHWFQRRLAQQNPPSIYETDEDADAAFTGAIADDGVVAEAWAHWRAETAASDRIVAEYPLDTVRDSHGRPISLRAMLVHVVEEYARHNGHADLLRERIDGRIGE
jgi:uncharacterized damage-inducible protein DinB